MYPKLASNALCNQGIPWMPAPPCCHLPRTGIARPEPPCSDHKALHLTPTRQWVAWDKPALQSHWWAQSDGNSSFFYFTGDGAQRALCMLGENALPQGRAPTLVPTSWEWNSQLPLQLIHKTRKAKGSREMSLVQGRGSSGQLICALVSSAIQVSHEVAGKCRKQMEH